MGKRVRVAQVRQLFRLVDEAVELERDRAAMQRHVLDGLARIFGAAVAIKAVANDFKPGGRASIDPDRLVELGWSGSEVRELVFGPYVQHGLGSEPLVQRALASRQPYLTARRQDVLSDEDWYGAGYVAEGWMPSRIDHPMFGIRFGGDRSALAIGLLRERMDQPYDEEDRELLDIFFSESAWIFHEPTMLAKRRLSPRERSTLDALLSGRSEKEIASTLGLSPHTVHDYVKSVYRTFGVASRAELLARCLR